MFQKPRLTYYRTFFPRSTRNNYNIPTANHRHRVPVVRPNAQENAMAKIMAIIGKSNPLAPAIAKPVIPEVRPRAILTLNGSPLEQSFLDIPILK
ncbi:hypothetical protein BX616_004015 [Lobosporangium transversale]|nr:hypothetical protein BX616_004015 [Lobosporangium transversale]